MRRAVRTRFSVCYYRKLLNNQVANAILILLTGGTFVLWPLVLVWGWGTEQGRCVMAYKLLHAPWVLTGQREDGLRGRCTAGRKYVKETG